jgi:methyl-accepting chemotaxis protein
MTFEQLIFKQLSYEKAEGVIEVLKREGALELIEEAFLKTSEILKDIKRYVKTLDDIAITANNIRSEAEDLADKASDLDDMAEEMKKELNELL